MQALTSAPTVPAAQWRRMTLVSSGSALIVARALGPDGAKVVVKVATEEKAANELRRDASTRQCLAADGRLGGWSALLPEVLVAELGTLPAVAVERQRGCCDGRSVLAGPLPVAAVALRNALEAVAELHGRTGGPSVVGEALVRQWVREPLALVASLYQAGSWQARSLAHLEASLADVLIGRRVFTGWSHGDYAPGNLLFAGEGGGTLGGVVDWGAASPTGLLGRDTAILVITTVMLRNRLDLGGVIIRLLGLAPQIPDWQGQGGGQGRWLALERLALEWDRQAAWSRAASGPAGGCTVPLPASVGDGDQEAPGPVTTLWLAWVQHVARNIAKAEMYSRRRAWRIANIDVVLTLVRSAPMS